jgi:hypothetical protein
MKLVYGKSAYRRDNGNLPELRLVNMFVEQSATGSDGAVLLSRPGFAVYHDLGQGPVRGLWSSPDVFDTAIFTLSGGQFFRNGNYQANLPGDGPLSVASSVSFDKSNRLLVNAGAGVFRYRGYNQPFDPVTIPNDAAVSSLAYLSARFIASLDGSNRLYWSDVGDEMTWNALSFAAAQASPDHVTEIHVVGDLLWVFKPSVVEFWQPTSDANLPFQVVPARTFQRGLYGRGCAALLDNTMFWIGDDRSVYRGAEIPQRVSDFGIEERIRSSAHVSASAFTWQGHAFFAIRLDSGTFLFDAATGQWSEWQSFGLGRFRGSCFINARGNVYMGDDTLGRVWRLDEANYDDFGGTLERLFTGAFELTGGTVAASNVQLLARPGYTPLLAGLGADPVAEMRRSRDAGATWSEWQPAPLGEQGSYRKRTIWRRQGMFDAPGGLMEVRCTDPVPFAVGGLTMNEPLGGRSR